MEPSQDYIWEREPTDFIGIPGTTKNELNSVQEDFETTLKARKKPSAKHMWKIWDRYVGKILDTRFEVTKSRLNFVSFDMEMEINLHDMEVVASFSFDGDIHGKIGTNECNMPSRPPTKPGEKEADEVDTIANMSRAFAITFKNTNQTITNLSKNEKVPNIGSMIRRF